MANKIFMNGTVSDVPNKLSWTPLVAISPTWDLNANVAMINENTVNINGLFTSKTDNNVDPVCGFPQGFKPFDFKNNVPANNEYATSNLFSDSSLGEYGILKTGEAMAGDVLYVNIVYLLNENQEANVIPEPEETQSEDQTTEEN